MRGLIIALLFGVVPLLCYLGALIFDDSTLGTFAAYALFVTLPVWAASVALLLAIALTRRLSRRSAK
jgi:hypothetical protein